MRKQIRHWLTLGVVAFLAGYGAAQVPQVRSIGAEERMPGSFAGRLSSIAVDGRDQPHMAFDGGQFICLYDKINGAWTDLLIDVRALSGSSQYYNPCLMIDPATDIAWVSGVLYGGRMGIGLITRQGISGGSPVNYWTIRNVVPASMWPVGNLGFDPGRPGEVMASASSGWWERLAFDASTPAGCRFLESGQMWAGHGGEKNAFWISRAGNVVHANGASHGVWHGAIGGWDGWSSSYQNSLRQAQGLPTVTWANFAQYPEQGDDGSYICVVSDNRRPEIAYISAGYRGVGMNIWNGSAFVFLPSAILSIDPNGGSGLRRFAPQMTPTKNGGVFICWTRDGRIKLQYVDRQGNRGAEIDVCTGSKGSLCADSQGHLHLAYQHQDGARYRKILLANTSAVRGDYDGDGKAEFTIYQAATGEWRSKMSSLSWTEISRSFGAPGYEPVQGDFDGDGVADLAVYNEAAGLWYMALSSEGGLVYWRYFGGPGCRPVPADYDGDGGKTDLAVYNMNNGLWHILLSNLGWRQLDFQFGVPDCTPVPGDYDGDYHTDPAVYHRPSGTWFIAASALNYTVISFPSGRPGFADDAPVTGDFNGDGMADLGLFNAQIGCWAFILSSPGWTQTAPVFLYLPFQAPGYTPICRDFDGDGKTDLAIYSEAYGNWFLALSTQNFGLLAPFPFVFAPGYMSACR